MAKSQQTFNKLEREKNKAKKREEKRKKMQARKAVSYTHLTLPTTPYV